MSKWCRDDERMSKLRDRLINPKDIERYDRNYNSMEVYITQGELDKEYIHIPENATNGDMIKAVFPNGKTIMTNGLEIGYRPAKPNDKWIIWFMQDWWNAKYKSESEDKE